MTSAEWLYPMDYGIIKYGCSTDYFTSCSPDYRSSIGIVSPNANGMHDCAKFTQLYWPCIKVIVYILYAHCDHPKFIEPLRQEITRATATNPEDPLKEMHLLDSFLTEVFRLPPPDALTVQRKVKKEFTTPSGSIIPPGNLIAVLVLVQSRNPHVFVDPDRFDGRRFLLKHDQTQGADAISRFTDLRHSFLFWGAPRKAW